MRTDSKGISALQEEVDHWIKTVGVRYFNELTNMAQLSEEVGEVARIIARRYGEQSEKESDKSKDLGEELADVLCSPIVSFRRQRCHLAEPSFVLGWPHALLHA